MSDATMAQEHHLHANLLHGLEQRLDRIETKLDNVGVLDERMSAQVRLVDRHSEQIDSHAERLREAEIKAVSVHNFSEELRALTAKTETIQDNQVKSQGAKAVAADLLKWASGVGAALLVYSLTNSVDALEALKNVSH